MEKQAGSPGRKVETDDWLGERDAGLCDEPSLEATTGITGIVADFALGTTLRDLPPAAVHAAERIILDTIACAVAAADTAPGRALLRFKLAQGGPPQSTVAGSAERL